MINRKTHKIDATNKVLGRLASKVAILLRGKHKVTFQPSIDDGDIVEILNINKIKITGRKADTKEYYHFSGYPGGLKTAKFASKLESDPSFILKHAVMTMLPRNTTRKEIIKRLRFIK